MVDHTGGILCAARPLGGREHHRSRSPRLGHSGEDVTERHRDYRYAPRSWLAAQLEHSYPRVLGMKSHNSPAAAPMSATRLRGRGRMARLAGTRAQHAVPCVYSLPSRHSRPC